MLLEHRPGGGSVSVQTRNSTFNRLMVGVLAEWAFISNEEAANVDILLLERGLPVPSGSQQVIWLTPMPLGDEPHIEVPLSITELYHRLELRFFPQPRHHIRLPLDQPVDLCVRGVWLVGTLLSISDRGARVSCPAHLPTGERLQIDFLLGKHPLRLAADVLYEIPPGDTPGRELPQTGLLFKPLKPALRTALRQFIEWSFVEQACRKSGITVNDPALSWFNLVRDPWAEVSG